MYKVNEELFFKESEFGWIACGKLKERQICKQGQCFLLNNDSIQDTLKLFFDLEGLGIRDDPVVHERDQAMEIFKETVEFENGRYIVQLPFRKFYNELSDNYSLSKQRFQGLWRRFGHDSELYQQYREIILDYAEQDRSFYGDDLISGGNEFEEALQTSRRAKYVMEAAGMDLRKWITNDTNLMEQWKKEKFDVHPVHETVSLGANETKVLGLSWNTHEDYLTLDTESLLEFLSLDKNTKRFILQAVGKIFDPLGLISPFAVRMKCLLQDLWRDEIQWDDPLPTHIEKEWKKFIYDCRNKSKKVGPLTVAELKESEIKFIKHAQRPLFDKKEIPSNISSLFPFVDGEGIVRGGMRAVLWTDLFQALFMFFAVFAIIIKGTVDVGGLSEVWRIASEGERIELFNFDPDPTVRHTFWTVVVGGVFTCFSLNGINQSQVQRLLTSRSLKESRIASYYGVVLQIIFTTAVTFSGLVIYANFSKCDPILRSEETKIRKADQILPYFVMTSLSAFPGLPGLFVAGIFSACLSSVSSAINSLAAATVEDFLHPICLRNVSEKWTTIFTKLTALSYGIICIFLTFVIDQAEGLLQTFGLILFNVVGGPMLGLFTLGMLFRRPTSKGAMTGYLLSLGLSSFIALRGVMNGGQKKPSSHLSTAECPSNFSISLDGYLNSTYDDLSGSGNWTTPSPIMASKHVI
ncbi:putative sodium-dependent multivitamin transporter, partial [Nephila pilipes]